jgi:hypothetical protein
VESNHHNAWRRGYSAVSSPMLSVRVKVTGRARTDASGFTVPGAPVYTTATTERRRRDSNPRSFARQATALAAELRPPEKLRGWDSNPRPELMRLARRAAPPRVDRVWPAGIEPAISGAQNRRGGLLPYDQSAVDDPGVEPGTTGISDRRVPALARRRRSTPRGTRTRLPGLRDRCPEPPRRTGHEAATAGVEPASTG